MSEKSKALVEAARRAQARAYAPYSKFPVGAAIETRGGTFAAPNVENASYGLSICAERAAVVAAVAAGQQEIRRVAIVSHASPPAPPCGMCIQTLVEFGADDVEVTLSNGKGAEVTLTLGELSPHGFRATHLE